MGAERGGAAEAAKAAAEAVEAETKREAEAKMLQEEWEKRKAGMFTFGNEAESGMAPATVGFSFSERESHMSCVVFPVP